MSSLSHARIAFHALLLVADVVCLYLIFRWKRTEAPASGPRSQSTVPNHAGTDAQAPLMPIVILATLVPVVAGVVQKSFGLHWIGGIRLISEAYLWHFPVLLFLISRRAHGAAKVVLRALAFLLAGIYLYAFQAEPVWLEVTHYTFSPPLLAGLHRPVRIVELSDIQTERVGWYERKVFSMVASLKPDLVFYTGDYVDGATDPDNVILARDLHEVIVRSGLKPALGSYAVKGDSDSFRNMDLIFGGGVATFIDNDVILLQLLGVRVNLIGVSAGWSRNQETEPVRRMLRKRLPGLFDICIAHSPEFAEAMSETGNPYLLFAGHTHGGQVQLPWFGPLYVDMRMPRRYGDFCGYYKNGGILSVSRGIGMERGDSPRVRFLCRPEIRVVELQPPGR